MTSLRKEVKVELPEQPGGEPEGNTAAARFKHKRVKRDGNRLVRNKGRR